MGEFLNKVPNNTAGEQSSLHYKNSFFFKPFIQPKLSVNQPDDAYEQEADTVADKVMRMPEPSAQNNFFFQPVVQRKCAHCEDEEKKMQRTESNSEITGDTSRTENYISSLSGGNKLNIKERSFFESRMGYDFSNVRLHTNSEANQSAKNINALAYTHNNNIVFDENKYQPETTEGKKLLAHELTHVVQQNSSSNLKRKKAPLRKVPAFVEEALRMKAEEEKKIIKFVSSIMEPESLPVVRKYLAFTQAVAAENKQEIKKLFTEFQKSSTNKLPQFYPTRESVGQIISKLIDVDLIPEAQALQSWYPRQQIHDNEPHKNYDLDIYLWQSIMDNLPDITKVKNADTADKLIEKLLRMLKYIEPVLSKLFEQQKREAKPINTSRDPTAPKDFDTTDYIKELVDDMSSIFTSFQVLYQLVFDKAAADLGVANGDAYLQLAKKRLYELSNISLPLQKFLDITKTIPKQKRGKIIGGKVVDYFPENYKAQKKSVAINFYSPEPPDFIAEQNINISQILTFRKQQIALVEKLYGLEKDDTGNITTGAKENAAAIKKAGKLKLHSNEDWRKFLFEKFELAKTTKGTAAAFDEVILLIKLYMDAFTTHTPYNIDDFGDNQLSINFPRALTGQLIHDCGVYALRITFMLSLLRNHPDLKLQIRFVRMPEHVGLVITGNGLPVYFVNNNQIEKKDILEIDDLYKQWQKRNADKNLLVRQGADSKQQFLDEVEASKFIDNVTMPYRSFDAPVLTGNDRKDVAALWKFYQKNINPEIFNKGVYDPKSKFYGFHLKYLETLQAFKNFYNSEFVPFWNTTVVHCKKDITDALKKGDKAKFKNLVAQYEILVNTKFEAWKNIFKSMDEKKAEIDTFITQNPDVMEKNTFTNLDRTIDTNWLQQQKDIILNNSFTQPNDPRDTILEPIVM